MSRPALCKDQLDTSDILAVLAEKCFLVQQLYSIVFSSEILPRYLERHFKIAHIINS
jgi:hypothetical protein